MKGLTKDLINGYNILMVWKLFNISTSLQII